MATLPVPLIEGLSEDEVVDRRSRGQGNKIKVKTSRSFTEILRENLFTFFNVVLFILGFALIVLGKPVEALITSGVLLINVFVAAAQEVRAKRKLDQIALLARPKATVVRGGIEKKIDPDEIVKDDVLIVGPGDQIVVDGEVIGPNRADVDESLLTGEADLIPKRAGDKLFSGSFCVTGRVHYVAQQVGADSFANQLTSEARTFTRHLTPLQREVNLMIRVLLAVITFFGILLAISAIMNEVPILQSVQEASVLFGLAPSSLFLMIVVAYAVGAVRIANKGALVQQANSVESLCNVTILCLDKTGTLTTNRIHLDEIRQLSEPPSPWPEPKVHRILGDVVRSATSGNRTSEAIVASCDGQARPFYEEVTFASVRGWSALSFDQDDLKGVYVLGAPEVLHPSLVSSAWLGPEVADWAAQGLRVLLFAYRPEIEPLFTAGGDPRLPGDLHPLLLLCFSDELRPEARQTLNGFAEAGIKLKIISGDNPKTVSALARQAGLEVADEPGQIVSGLELASMDEAQFNSTAHTATIFGRITPEQKEKLVSALRNQGHYVAMTGDGVNDVLALKKSNLGIAMQSGSQATRSVADIVLLNDTFAVLPETFKEGQRILTGMQDVLRLYMTRILYLAVLVAAISIVGVGFPFTPGQNAIISIVTLSLPAFALAIWARPGPVPRTSMTRKIAHFVVPAVITVSAAGLIVYLYFLVTTRDMLYAQQALTHTVVACGLILIIFVEPPTRWWVGGDVLSGDWRPTLMAIGLLVVYALFHIVPVLRDFYSLSNLERPAHYVFIAMVVIVWVIILRYIWRARLVERYLNVDFGQSDILES